MTREEKQERNQVIVEKAKEGATLPELAQSYKLSLSTIRDILRAAGLQPQVKTHVTKREKIKELLEEGVSLEQIAKRVNTSIYTVRSMALHEGKLESRTEDRKYYIIQQLMSGRQASDIAKELGLTRSYISLIRQKCVEYEIIKEEN